MLANLSDHILLKVCIPMPTVVVNKNSSGTSSVTNVYYKWNEGTCVSDYANAAQVWTDYTNNTNFKSKFAALVYDVSISNDTRAEQVETFLVEEAVSIGVVRKIEMRAPKNPNKWGKTLAPWFNEECRLARRTVSQLRR